jgi:hypothetical protein
VTQDERASGGFDFDDASQRLAEVAIRNEEMISTAAREMQQITHQLGERVRTLPDWITGEVDRRLVATIQKTATEISARLTDATGAAERAQAHYEKAVKFAVNKIVRIALACFVCGCIAMVLGVYISARVILPAPDVLQRQREAEQNVEKLAPRGGNSVLSMCTTAQGKKLCIRTDERGEPNPWGQGETYRIIYGY